MTAIRAYATIGQTTDSVTPLFSEREKLPLAVNADFRKTRKKAGKEEGIAVWGPVNPPQELGIRGNAVGVDWDICTGCGICLDVCPMQVYEWRETPGHPTSEQKAFPVRERDCVQCLKCEDKCPEQAVNVTFLGPQSGWDQAIVYIMFLQIIGGIVYGAVFGPYWGVNILQYIGWLVLAIGLPFFASPLIYFTKRGKPQENKNLMLTTVIVDSGTYGIVRHPQVLGCIMVMLAAMLISQHWAAVIIGVPLSAYFYIWAAKEEKSLLVKFGDDYKSYMQKVPRMNLLLGIIRRLQRGSRGQLR